MRKITLLLLGTIIFNVHLYSQNNIDKVIAEIEKNNTTLSAMQKSAAADKIRNKTGINLQNPEIEFNYLWGNPADMGNRTDLSIIQSFDFPTAYGYRHQISDFKNEQVDFELQKQRKSLLVKVRLICYDLYYTNALMSEFSDRLSHAQSIANSYKAQFDIGETNILAYNKSQLNLLNIRKEMELLAIEKNALSGELTMLNGGIFINFTDSVFPPNSIPPDFEQWYIVAEQSNPLLKWLKTEVEINRRQISLNKAMSLPKFKTGYMSENVTGQKFQGISFGVSLPLWENKNTVKYAKTNAYALENIASDHKIQFYTKLKTLHAKAFGLQKNVIEYRSNLKLYSNTELLKKALDKGEISLIDYMLELSIYYESIKKILELERELNKTIAELNQYM